MGQRTKESERHIDVVLRALDVLDCFQSNPVLSLKEIIDRTGITRSRAMRLIGTLESRGYLIEDTDTKRYYPGIRLAVLGKMFEKFNNIDVITRPVLKQLAIDTGESATLYVVDGMERVALIREEGPHAIRYSVREGQRLPIDLGASAKVLLAFGPESLLESVSSRSPKPPVFFQQIDRIRKQGYAVSKGENVPGAHAIAAPVFNFNSNLVGALGIAGPSIRLNDEEMKKRVKAVVDAADILSERFGKAGGAERPPAATAPRSGD